MSGLEAEIDLQLMTPAECMYDVSLHTQPWPSQKQLKDRRARYHGYEVQGIYSVVC